MLGVNPDPFTLRQLLWMEDARIGEQWGHTSYLVAQVLSSFSSKPINPAEINPYLAAKRHLASGGKKRYDGKKLKAVELGRLLGAKPLKKSPANGV